jgi:hypothetical protein
MITARQARSISSIDKGEQKDKKLDIHIIYQQYNTW